MCLNALLPGTHKKRRFPSIASLLCHAGPFDSDLRDFSPDEMACHVEQPNRDGEQPG